MDGGCRPVWPSDQVPKKTYGSTDTSSVSTWAGPTRAVTTTRYDERVHNYVIIMGYSGHAVLPICLP